MFKKSLIGGAVLAVSLSALSSFAQSPTFDPTTQKFLDDGAAANPPPLYAVPAKDARERLDSLQKTAQSHAPSADIRDIQVAVGPTGSTKVRIYRPAGEKGVLPVLVYIHGAGWVMGGPATHDRLMRDLVAGSQVEIVFVDYDRSPESRYPAPLEQNYAVLRYAAEHPKEFNIDPKRIAIGGDSAGGNMAAAVVQIDQERKGPKLVAQVLLYPVIDALLSQPSQKEFANGPYLNYDAMVYFLGAYLGPDVDRSQPHVTVINASLDALRGQPQALVITDENDVLRDEGEAYARKLLQAGVRTTSIRIDNTFHDFMMLNALADTPPTRAAINETNQFLISVLGQK